jgi:hypothetical protein
VTGKIEHGCPLTCVYCRRAPATRLLVADLKAGRVAHLVCARCGTRNVRDAGKIARAPSAAWLFALTPVTEMTAATAGED